ncbi:hypothetical protein EXIGLDRAFT_753174 [Exidia glandulosa HHB12029]|uniref:Uncharacterized protein n=1 Tax=Exidia glandulosa HHB12029 TaxID=1314781 RepID=A0A165DZ44_EXIGL|nr:hypothetical protein EXIGLDRAFT_753174 [Exidia glandulosa HHB12029]
MPGDVEDVPAAPAAPAPRLKIKLTLNPPKPLSLYDRIKAKQENQQRSRQATPVGAASGGSTPQPSDAPAAAPVPAPLQRRPRGRPPGSRTKKKAPAPGAVPTKRDRDRARARDKRLQTTPRPRGQTKNANPAVTDKSIPPGAAARRILTSATPGSARSGYNLYVHSDSDSDETDAYPTFVSASGLSTSSDEEGDDEEQEGGQDDSADDESSELTDLDDFSVQDEEERFIIADEKARVRRELLGDNDPEVAKKQRDWQMIPRQKGSSATGSTAGGGDDSDSNSDSTEDEQLEDDEDVEDEPEPDVHARGELELAADRYWSSSEDDFDAAVFFASLDSENEAKSSDGDDSDDSILGAQSLDESAQAGLFARISPEEHLPMVTQDVHGLLVFGDAVKDAALDMAFDIPSVPPTAVQSPNPEAPGDSTEDEDEEDLRSAADAMDVDSTDDDLGLEETDGATTDDMCEEDLDRVRAPTPPPTGVNPLATLRTPTTDGARRSKKHDRPVPLLSQKPTDILGRRRAASLTSSNGTTSPSVSSSRIVKFPSMGRFESPAQVKMVIIDGRTQNIPSPFARKLRRERANRVRFPKSRRQASPSPLLSGGEVSEDSMYSLHAGPSSSQFISLHDVLDTAILEDDEDELEESQSAAQAALISASESDAAVDSNGVQHLRNLSRWDRIPMNTFRRTRSDVSLPSMTMSLPVGLGYGAGLKNSSGWWDSDNGRKRGRRERERTTSMNAMLALSPILFPVRGGGGGGGDEYGNQRAHNASQLKIHRDKERRKKKSKSKTVDSAAVKPVKRPIHAQRASSLVNVPPLRI